MDDPAANQPEHWVILAHLLRPQGRKGELLAELLTDFPDRFADRQGISLRRPDGTLAPAAVDAHWLPTGRNAGRIVLKFQGIDSISAAEPLSGCDVVVPATQRVPLDEDEDEQYIADLLDCTVLDGGRTVGIVHDVHFPTTATGARLPDAAPLLIVHSPAGDEILIPFAKSWIASIDVANRQIVMHLPEGLLDING
jgi:16S rRNA processing protein RimM